MGIIAKEDKQKKLEKVKGILEEHYPQSAKDGMSVAVTDLAADLMHYARNCGLDTSKLFTMANKQYNAEVLDELEDFYTDFLYKRT